MLRNEQLTLVRSSSVITKQVVALNLDKPQKKSGHHQQMTQAKPAELEISVIGIVL